MIYDNKQHRIDKHNDWINTLMKDALIKQKPVQLYGSIYVDHLGNRTVNNKVKFYARLGDYKRIEEERINNFLEHTL